MNVSDAVERRQSIRAFTDEPVGDDLLAELLTKASQAPSGGNVQPWRIYVVNGESMERFREFISDRQPGAPAYDIYPPGLHEPYRTIRFQNGEQLYASIGIGRDDKAGRLGQFAKNLDFFGAPAALFCFIDRKMGPPQWSDLGMFLQTFMLLAQEAGVDTCAQEAWAVHEPAVMEFAAVPEELQLFCGMAIGHADRDDPINGWRSERQPLEEWATFL